MKIHAASFRAVVFEEAIYRDSTALGFALMETPFGWASPIRYRVVDVAEDFWESPDRADTVSLDVSQSDILKTLVSLGLSQGEP